MANHEGEPPISSLGIPPHRCCVVIQREGVCNLPWDHEGPHALGPRRCLRTLRDAGICYREWKHDGECEYTERRKEKR